MQQATGIKYKMTAHDIDEQVFTGRCNMVSCMVEAYCPHWPSATGTVLSAWRRELGCRGVGVVICNFSTNFKSRWVTKRIQTKRTSYSSFVKVRTQSISEISQRLTKESALPTAKYLQVYMKSYLSCQFQQRTVCKKHLKIYWLHVKQLYLYDSQVLNDIKMLCYVRAIEK